MLLTKTKVPQQGKKVQEAFDIVSRRYAQAGPDLKPRIHAHMAVLNADLIDRRVGLTVETALEENLEYTPGLVLALKILAGKA